MIEPNLVSILVPVQNSEKYLAEALESLLKQTYSPIEILAIDDNSKDNSYKILRKYARRDKRVRVSQNKKRYGLSITLNRLVREAKGQYIALMSPTDLSNPQRLERQVAYLQQNPKTVAVGAQCQFVDAAGVVTSQSNFETNHEAIAPHLLSAMSVQVETVLLDRTLLPKDILYFPNRAYPLIYTDLLLKIASYGTYENMPELLHAHRLITQDKNITKGYLSSCIKMWIASLRSYDNYRPSFKSLFMPVARSLASIIL